MNNEIEPTKSFSYNTRYLDTDIVKKCFNPGSHNLVDKIICGNGFTFNFLKIPPSKKYQCNIIIVPNKRVVQSKQQSYNRDFSKNKALIGFIYGDDSTNRVDFNRFDTMMFVVDSFLNYIDVIKKNRNLVDKILIDECHSMLIQSTFRHKLVGFSKLIKETFPKKAIVSVTATPMLFQNANIKLLPTEIEQRTINVTENQESSLERIKKDLKDNKKVIVALHDARLLRKLTDAKNVLSANIKVGNTLYQKILENVILKLDENSNLTIISSAGFEGFDVCNGINNIYIFEDRAFDYQTFYTQNILQVLGRSRKGTNYIEWCRLSNRTRKALMSKKDMIKKSVSKKISFEKKMTDSKYSYIPKFFDKAMHKNFGLITRLELNHDKYDLEDEMIKTDLKGLSIYDEYLKERGFVIHQLNEGSKRITLRSPSHKKAFERVKENKAVLSRFKIFDDIRIDLYQKEKTEYYIKAYEVFLRRKYWYEDKMRFTLTENEYKYLPTDEANEMKGYKAIKNNDWIKQCVKYISAVTKAEAQKRYNRKGKEYAKWVADFEKNIEDRYIRLVMAIGQTKIRFPKKERNHRDFNLTTEISINILKDVCRKFNKNITEIDIVSCNMRIIYAFLGLKLPNYFYGINKINKIPINRLINKLSKEFPLEYKINVDEYKRNRIKEMRSFGFDERVISFLINTFWDKPKDAMYNFCAYHEKNICRKLMCDFIEYSERVILEDSSYRDEFKNTRYTRRHDSIIIFESPIMMNEVIENFEYLDQKNWFNNDKIEWLKWVEKRQNRENVAFQPTF